ncbi:unnamed protein product [Rotaria magnacalcarata]
MDSKTKANEDLETLTCPITLQLFRDPVIATDGHAYERVAIVKWIEKHGTSPMTREPLNVADLQSDEYLKQLASQRRTSTVSQMTQYNSVIIPVISANDIEHKYSADMVAYNQNLTQLKKGTRCMQMACLIMVVTVCLTCMIVGLVIELARKSKSDTVITQTTLSPAVQTSYASQLTSNSPTYNCVDCSSQDHYYGAFLLNASTNDYYRVSIQSSAAIFTYLYASSFLPSDPSSNQIPLTNTGIDIYNSNFFIYLQRDMQYILIVTSRNIFTEAIFLINIVGSNYVYIVPISNNYSTTVTSPSTTTVTSPSTAIVTSPDTTTVTSPSTTTVTSPSTAIATSPDTTTATSPDTTTATSPDTTTATSPNTAIATSPSTATATSPSITTVTSTSTTTSSPSIPTNARWSQNAVTVAGDNIGGNGTDQLLWPDGLTVDGNQTIFVADYENNRIVQWNIDDSNGLVVAGGHGPGNKLNQLYHPIDVSIDKDTNSLIICDYGNKRVLQWSLQSGTTQGEILLSGTFCSGLALDKQRNIYVSSTETFEVTRYQMGSTNGTIVAGGNGAGLGLNQFRWPTYLFVDANQNVYVSDKVNNRVMKWSIGAQEGIVVAGGRAMTKMSTPRGLFVDASGTLYVVDAGNQRVLRWLEGAKQGSVIVDGNGIGNQQNQLNSPMGLAFDRQGNMYVVDSFNHRVQQFSIE